MQKKEKVHGLDLTKRHRQGKLALMRLYKLLFWFILVFIITVWEAVDFILALVKRSSTLSECEQSHPDAGSADSSGDSSISVAGYKTTFLGMQVGDTYGLANCGQAVQAGVIGLAIVLFLGTITFFYFGMVVSSYTTKLRERNLGHRLRDDEWNDNLDDLSSAYRSDRNVPKYRMNTFERDTKGNKFTKGLKKFKFGK